MSRVKEKPEDSNEEHLGGKEYVRSRKNFEGKKITRGQGGKSEMDPFGEVAVNEEVILSIFNQHYKKVVIKLIYPYQMSHCLSTVVC